MLRISNTLRGRSIQQDLTIQFPDKRVNDSIIPETEEDLVWAWAHTRVGRCSSLQLAKVGSLSAHFSSVSVAYWSPALAELIRPLYPNLSRMWPVHERVGLVAVITVALCN